MKVFLSWSGTKSKAVAAALQDWLPYVIQSVKPWMSEQDIHAGARWETELSQQLNDTDCGILCLTLENLEAPWLLFEAGALGKTISYGKVIPYRLGVASADVRPPLSQFQGVDADVDGTCKLVQSLNRALPEPLPEGRLNTLFAAFWPTLESSLKAADSQSLGDKASPRSTHEYFGEVLDILRRLDANRSTTSSDSLELAISFVREEIKRTESALAGMLKYEASGGGASTEIWWDSYVGHRREAIKLLNESLVLLERSREMARP